MPGSATFSASLLRRGDGNMWSPEFDLPSSLWEMFGSGNDVAAEAMAIEMARSLSSDDNGTRPWLWVQDRQSIRRTGRPYLHGVPQGLRASLIHISASRPADALWAMEEGVRCSALSFVIGELADDPQALDFTATRRLVLASEASGVPLILVRNNGSPNLSAARMRWRVEAAASLTDRWNERAPGQPTWQAELFRARGFRPGRFHLTYSTDRRGHEADGKLKGAGLHLVSEPSDRPMDEDRRASG